MNNLDKQYQDLLQTILDYGVEKKDRTGTGTKSIFGYTIRHNMSEGFPVLTTKKMAWKTMVTELLWFLRGDTNIKFLVDNNCHIWDGDAYKNYLIEDAKILPNMSKEKMLELGFRLTKEEFINKIKTDDEFAKKWGDLGPVYGKQWRRWGRKNVTNYDLKDVKGSDQHRVLKAIEIGEDVTKYGVKIEYQNNSIDQITNLINDLKTNPDSRRLMVNAWNVGELDQMVLPPCHYGFQVYTRELSLDERINYYNSTKDPLNQSSDYHDVHMDSLRVPKRAISLMWNQRSVDTFLGLPFNIASYGLLLEIIAKEVNMVPDELIGNLGDTHLYSNHVEQAREQIGRKYTHEEREGMLKEAMGPNGYKSALKDLAPFGGGMSEYYEIYKIPRYTREPYKLPKLKHMKTDEFYKSLSEDSSLITHLENKDFQIENYQSHPSIKAPLSN
jgi:thymidylate synthase